MKFTTYAACLLSGVSSAACVARPQKSPPTVSLDYATYQGVRLPGGVDQYLGMRYAAAPVGDLRFRGPQDPEKESGVQDASNFGPICVGAGQTASTTLTEDCLFVNVFKPSDATPKSKLPVWVFIQGGGYATNYQPNYNGTGVVMNSDIHNGTDMVLQSDYNIVFVNFNYRVGALGFLASEEVQADGDLNAGLLDQRKLLEWVQENIAKFGGDPDHVVIHGASAGAGSVAIHLTAYDGEDKGLFVGAVPQSPFWPTQRNLSELEFQYNRFVADTGCANATNALACLRSADLATIQTAGVTLPWEEGSDEPLPVWYWLPVTTGPGTLVPANLYDSFQAGKFIKVPLMIGDDTDEGTVFAYDAATPEDVARFFKNNYPLLDQSALDKINDAYPLTDPLPMHGAYFPSAAAAYGDSTFTCPGNTMAETMSKFYEAGKVWNYRYNVADPGNTAIGYGVLHTFESAAIFGPGYTGGAAADSYYTTNANIVPVVMNYYISFVRALDPNVYRYPGTPVWETWGDAEGGKGFRLKFETNDTVMEEVPQQLVDRCALWKELSNAMEV
ncbi:carboxylesterase [Diaporthe helianthi]|uniref:Carboxylic ester hydrolase n=1 Tax=Diaporthe helianthi TaxID=158607 RepID=A0A2P5IBG2_DIAHE|nr:carboxylesterase [Diaporthe helianthi]